MLHSQYPHLLAKVFIISAGIIPLSTTESIERLKRDRFLANSLDHNFNDFLTQWYSQPLFDSDTFKKNKSSIISTRLSNNPLYLKQALLAFSPGAMSHYEINGPNLVYIVGENDHKYMTISLELLSRYSIDKIHIVKSSGHMCHMEHPSCVSSIIGSTLNPPETLRHESHHDTI